MKSCWKIFLAIILYTAISALSTTLGNIYYNNSNRFLQNTETCNILKIDNITIDKTIKNNWHLEKRTDLEGVYYQDVCPDFYKAEIDLYYKNTIIMTTKTNIFSFTSNYFDVLDCHKNIIYNVKMNDDSEKIIEIYKNNRLITYSNSSDIFGNINLYDINNVEISRLYDINNVYNIEIKNTTYIQENYDIDYMGLLILIYGRIIISELSNIKPNLSDIKESRCNVFYMTSMIIIILYYVIFFSSWLITIVVRYRNNKYYKPPNLRRNVI
jgi:hypothetical protein